VEDNALGWQQDAPAMADLFREAEDHQQPQAGDIRRGVITAIATDGITVKIAKQQGFVPGDDLAKLPTADRESLREGQEILVYVTDSGTSDDRVELSLSLARKEQDWLQAEELLQQKGLWEGRVSGHNKGGLVVPFGYIRGFVPASQITGFPRNLPTERKLARLAEMVGRTLAFQVIEVDRRKRRLVLSERLGRAAQTARKEQRALAELRKGHICRGQVRSLTDYGAFVDLGGIVGLIHRTELAWFRVEHPCEIVQVGQHVEAYVLRVNRERGRVSLSLKRTCPDPWSSVTERYELGQLVEGCIIRRTGAGLFLLTDDGILGYVSEADYRQSSRTEDEVASNQRVLTRLVRIDGARRRLGLSLRRVRASEWDDWRNHLEQDASSDTDAVESEAPPEA